MWSLYLLVFRFLYYCCPTKTFLSLSHAHVYTLTEASTVKLSPESYSQPGKYLLENESESDAIYLQRVVRQLHDSQDLLRVSSYKSFPFKPSLSILSLVWSSRIYCWSFPCK